MRLSLATFHTSRDQSAPKAGSLVCPFGWIQGGGQLDREPGGCPWPLPSSFSITKGRVEWQAPLL